MITICTLLSGVQLTTTYFFLFLPWRVLHAEVMDYELSFAHKMSLQTLMKVTKTDKYSTNCSIFNIQAETSPAGVEKRMERVENQLALQDVQLAELNLKLQLMESSSQDGNLIWKIDNFMRRRHDAIIGKTPSLYSPPFYTRLATF